MTDLHVASAKPEDAAAVVDVIHAAFGARPPLDPPSTAMQESVVSVESAIAGAGAGSGALLATVAGMPAGAILLAPEGDWLGLRRVSVHPRFQHRGVATAMVGCAEEIAEEFGYGGVRLDGRAELPATVEFWCRRGYVETARAGTLLQLSKAIPSTVEVPTPEAMHALGVRLAGRLRAGDLLLLTGELGAGKTTLTQGIGVGLGVRGGVKSPTFVIARSHRSGDGGPPLVHVDAYRLGGIGELDDLDLDTTLDSAVTVVEWGEGLAEGLADDRLEIHITRSADEARVVRLIPIGRRWLDAPLLDRRR